MPKKLLIELPYLGNVAFYRYLLQFDEIQIEAHENFQKASYRNRCEIATPQGVQTMSVYVKGGRGKRQLYKEVQIAHDHHWLKVHWDSLQSNYRSSPYFEFYEDDFEAIYSKEYESLFEWNLDLFNLINELLNLDLKVSFTDKFEKNPEGVVDARSKFLPKHPGSVPEEIKYTQVFNSKTGFFPNLSIVDLLFAEGPNALQFLK